MINTYPEKIFKFCPRCGSDQFFVYSSNSHKCKKCDFHYYTNSAAAVAALIEDNNKLLLTKRGKDPMKGALDLPGGFVNIMEKAENALTREIKEELNIDIHDLKYFGSFPNRYLFSGLTYFTLDMAYVCKIKDFSTIKPMDDVADVLFIPLQEINIQEIGLESIKRIVQSYIDTKVL